VGAVRELAPQNEIGCQHCLGDGNKSAPCGPSSLEAGLAQTQRDDMAARWLVDTTLLPARLRPGMTAVLPPMHTPRCR
jgi:hypothetical protein